MSTFAVKIGSLLASTAIALGGTWWIYDQNLPKDLRALLEKQGHKEAKEESAFKAILEEHKDEMKGLEIFSELSTWKLKSWCEGMLILPPSEVAEDIKNKVTRFCVDDPKTVRGFLTKQGKTLISEDEDYKIVFSLYKNNSDFSSWIGKPTKSESSFENLKAKCNLELPRKLSDVSKGDLEKSSWWCVTPDVKTVKDLLTSENLNILSDTENSWEEQFETWKNTESIVQAIKKHDESFSIEEEKSIAGSKVKKWCESSMSKKLSEEGVYPTLYSQVKGVCANHQSKK